MLILNNRTKPCYMKNFKEQIYGSLGILLVTICIVCYLLYRNDLLL